MFLLHSLPDSHPGSLRSYPIVNQLPSLLKSQRLCLRVDRRCNLLDVQLCCHLHILPLVQQRSLLPRPRVCRPINLRRVLLSFPVYSPQRSPALAHEATLLVSLPCRLRLDQPMVLQCSPLPLHRLSPCQSLPVNHSPIHPCVQVPSLPILQLSSLCRNPQPSPLAYPQDNLPVSLRYVRPLSPPRSPLFAPLLRHTHQRIQPHDLPLSTVALCLAYPPLEYQCVVVRSSKLFCHLNSCPLALPD